MKKDCKRLFALLTAMALTLSLAACGGGENAETTAQTTAGETSAAGAETTAAPAESTGETASEEEETTAMEDDEPFIIPEGDMGGLDFVLADWWSSAEYEPEEPTNAWYELVSEYHDELQEKMNFTWSQIGLQNMGDYTEVLTNNMLANDPGCTAFYGKVEDVIPMGSQGLLYDWNDLDVDLESDLYSKKIMDYFSLNGHIYSVRPEYDQPREGIFFNKRLLEEAGLDPELPYELQAAGDWDWEHFEEICAALTKDFDGDGATDQYGFGGNNTTVMEGAIWGNGASYVERDENGKFIDGTLNPAFEEALTWAVSLYQNGYLMPYGDGIDWDRDYYEFANGHIGMMVCQSWVIDSYCGEMEDDLGFVMLPAGPQGHACTMMQPTGICIPASVDLETANKAVRIIEAWFNTYNNIKESSEMGVSFRDSYYESYSDPRAVDDTITAMVTDPECQIYDSYPLVPNFDIYGPVVDASKLKATPAECIESARPANQAAIDAANQLYGF